MMTAFGGELRAHRLAVGLSQNALARAVQVDPGYVNRLEGGTRLHLSREIALRLADVLGLDEVETDRFLFAARLAPERDWQTIAEDALARLAAVDSLVFGTRAREMEAVG